MFKNKAILLDKFKHFSLYLTLVLFIILNFLDFFQLFSLISNYPNDVDFFKKLLSWALILYLFASLSITKIITGFKNKTYDLILLFGYCCIVIPSLLLFYLSNVKFSTFYLFSFIANSEVLNFLLQNNLKIVLIGIFVIGVLSVLIFTKLPIHRESFVGSFNLDMENYFSHFQKFGLILMFNIFFAYTFFKYFMEWFALAIDAALLVLGFLYYVYYFLVKKEERFSFKALLVHVVNTGNSFFKQLILYLQDKKTFFIAISLLLTIHTLVDIGVYLIPFATGIDNGLYNVLGTENDNIYPLFSLTDSHLHHQFANVMLNNFESLTPLVVIISLSLEILVYVQTILFYFILLFMPFYVFFSTLQQHFEIPKKSIILFTLIMIFFQIVLYSNPALNNPIEFSISFSDDQQGVVFQTNSLFNNLDTISFSQFISNALSIIVIQLVLVFFLFFRYEKYQQFWISCFYISILVFFLLYSTVFAQNYIQSSYNALSNNVQYFTEEPELRLVSDYYLEYVKFGVVNQITPIKVHPSISPDILIDTDFYHYIDQRNFSNSKSYFGMELTVKDNFLTKYSFIPPSLNDSYNIFIYNYSNLDEDKNLNRIYLIIEGDELYFNEVLKSQSACINAKNKIPSEQQKVCFLEDRYLETLIDVKPSKNSFEIFQLSFVFIVISIFYIGGLIAYAIFYRNALEELKRRLF